LIRSAPFLIKPNLEELGELFDVSIHGPHDALAYAKQLNAIGIENVIISMGGDGALLVADGVALFAKAPEGKAVNTVGAGDSLVSGFIASYAAHNDKELAFRYGVASGSATAFSTDLCTKEAVEELLGKVKITPLQEKDVAK
jgi:1-phosphofructokinase